MHQQFVMGNEAIGLGALAAGVKVVAGYPGTPSTEVLETIAKNNPGDVHVEWSINEKAGLEVAAGAAYTGARSLVTMKQVGLNVASDPLMSLAYIGVKGGMVILVADDPGPISSQTEQDTRTFGMYSKLPVFDPSSVAEAYTMIQEAFDYSETYHTPVILRPTTRIDHGYASIDVCDKAEYRQIRPEGFVKDSSRWVIFPKLSLKNHALIEKRNEDLKTVFSEYHGNRLIEATGVCKQSNIGIVTHGISFSYVCDQLGEDHPRMLKVGTPFPFPEPLAERFLDGLEEVLVIEELDPVLERALIFLCGKKGISVTIHGKLDGTVKSAGENTVSEIGELLNRTLGRESGTYRQLPDTINLPVRPPVLCAGCPHRASFYAVKLAMKGKKTCFCGDIGCYTLGNAKPLDMCDTCLCMGAGINIAQGIYHVEPDTKAFAFVGDSTFFASGISGAINGFYNQADMTLVILDNSTTAMTGHQPHPGTGVTMMGEQVVPVDMEQVLRGLGIETVETVNPLDLRLAVETVKRVSEKKGMKAIIFRYPCIVKFKPRGAKAHVDEKKCISCRKCINELGCPGVIMKDGKAYIDETLCTGCTLCQQVCPVGAISGGEAASSEDILKHLPAKKATDTAKDGKGAEHKTVSQTIAKEETPEEGRTADGRIADGRTADGSAAAAETCELPGRNIVLAGVGGQGTVLASKLIATAAMNRRIPVKSAETIGMAQRGGSVFSYLRIGKGVHAPLIGYGEADLIIGFEPAEALRMLPYLKEGGTVVTSTRPVIPVTALTGGAFYDVDEVLNYLKNQVPGAILVDVESALSAIGNDKVLNTLLLGAALKTGNLGLTREDLKGAIRTLLPEKLQQINEKALDYEE